ncbi:hypothetical protein DICVIV_06374 [Dictyocaulus viviparus]|uniref:Uncharacterized protein n=1 Tax=Dictyocaulus viviparus TaxID=29172 RepID=A0A0D8XSA9_DICVI|nr:hypothetical protein DICVIV_06374 [Dictyocaulus viviparus]
MDADENLAGDDQQQGELNYFDHYSHLLQYPCIKQAVATYDWTKHRSRLLESALNRIEAGVFTVVNTAAKKILEVHRNCYVRPKEIVASVYNTGIEKTKAVVETSTDFAVRGGTFGLGAAVVATQVSLTLSTGCALLILNTIEEARKAGLSMLCAIRNAEQLIEQKIWHAVNEGIRVAKVPAAKLAESTNVFLDVVSVLVERSFGIVVEDNVECSVKQRVTVLAQKIVEAINDKARSKVIEPFSNHVRFLIDQLSKKFALVDLILSKHEWVLGKVIELSSSIHDMKIRIENEAIECRTRPEEVLMKSIRSISSKLKDNLQALKDKQIFGDGTKLESLINYLQEIDKNLGESNDIYEVRNEVYELIIHFLRYWCTIKKCDSVNCKKRMLKRKN